MFRRSTDARHRGLARLALPALLAALVALPASGAGAQDAASTRRARVTGQVTDASNGQPIPNANVQIVGTATAATTGADGRFVIPSAPVGVFSIEARRIGYAGRTQENVRLRADSVTTVNFALATNALRLTEMVVSATVDPTSGTRTPFAMDKVTAENLPVPPTGSVATVLAGKISGATISKASGAPGAGAYVQLRSPVSQFNANSPLYVIDGVFLNSQQTVTTQDLEALDIASIEVIKGAAAASLYGSRAASGVISITTNRGKNLAFGTTQFTLRGEYGQDVMGESYGKPQHHQYRVNAQGQYVNASGAVVPRTQRVVKADGIMDERYIDPLYDHIDQFFRPGGYNTQTATLQQNSAATNFLISYNRTINPGVVENSNGLQRQTIRINVDHRLRDALQVGASLSHSRATEDPSSITFSDLYRMNPDVDLRAPEPFGTSPYVIIPDSTETRTNPFYRQILNDNITKRMRTLLNVNASYRPRSWLTVDGFASYDRGDRQVTNYVPRGMTQTSGEGLTVGSLTISDDDVDGVNAQGGATLLKAFGDLTTRLSVRGETQREVNPFFTTNGTDFTITGVKDMDVARTKTVSSSLTDRRTNAGFANLGLDYGGKYIGDFLIRREGSSLFGPAARWNTFYRASGSWLINEESWFPFESLNLFKLRYTIGTAGTRPGFADQYEALDVDGTGAVSRQALGNPNLRPELSKEQEAGIDFIVKNRVSVSLTYVSNDTRDNLVGVPAPALAGYNTYELNTGRITGNTLEGTINAQILNNPKGLQWDVLLVGDKRRNFISEFNRTCYSDTELWRCEKTRIGTIWGNRHVRDKSALLPVHAGSHAAFDINDDGFVVPVGVGNTWRDGKAKNLWGTNVTIDGRTYAWGRPLFELDPVTGQRWFGQIMDGNPDLNFGMGHNFRYKGFRAFAQFTGMVGGKIYNNVRQTLYATNDHPDVDQFGKSDETKKPTAYYATSVADGNNNYSQAFVESGTYMRLSELTFGYQFDRQRFGFLRAMGASRMQIDLVGRNLLTWSKYTGLNPEASNGRARIDDTVYPLTRTFTAATTIVF
jgi:TonB-linked SusC/RagA family outer membrane protein